MRWTQFANYIAFSYECKFKRIFGCLKYFTQRLIGALKMKDDHMYPDIMASISDPLTNDFNTDFRIMSSLSLGLSKQKK